MSTIGQLTAKNATGREEIIEHFAAAWWALHLGYADELETLITFFEIVSHAESPRKADWNKSLEIAKQRVLKCDACEIEWAIMQCAVINLNYVV